METIKITGAFGEEYTVSTHSSGLKIYIFEKPDYNSAYALFGTKYGSIDTCFSVDGKKTEVPEGIAHFLEHKLFESEDGDAFTKYAKTGAYANAFTSFDRTCYLFSCSKRFEENLAILLDFVQSPYFTEKTVQKEQGIIGQEIRMYDDTPSWRVMFNMLEAMYHKHPVRIDIAGTVESIAQINADLLYRCYHTFYHPSNMFICIAGNVKTDEVLRQIDGAIKKTEPIRLTRITCDEPEEIVKPYVEQTFSVAQPMFCFGFKETMPAPEITVQQKVCMNLLMEMIAGDASPLYKELIGEGLINDEFDSEYFTGHGYAAVIFEGESDDPERVCREIKAEIARIKNEGLDKELFEAVRRAMFGDAVRTLDSVEGIAMQEVAAAMSGHGVFDEIEFLQAVTVEDVAERLSVLKEKNAVLSVVKPEGSE